MAVTARATIPVLVLNWNGIDDTESCIEHLVNQTYSDLAIHLIDNGSDQNNVARLQQLKLKHPGITLHLLDQNYGFTHAHNLIFEKILSADKAPTYVLLLNNDAFPKPDWAAQLITLADEMKADLVSSKMINYYSKEEIDNIGHRFLNTGEIIPEGTGRSSTEFNEIKNNVGPCAGAALYRGSMLQAIGTFDPYFKTGYEDAELGLRATILGYKSVYAPEAIVYHKISRSVARIRDFEYVKKTQLNIFYTYFKLLPAAALVLNLPFALIKYTIVLLINLLAGRWFFFKVVYKSIWAGLSSERKTIALARKQFQANHSPIATFQILKKMEFFLWFDMKRFFKHVVRGEKTQFEKVVQSPNRE